MLGPESSMREFVDTINTLTERVSALELRKSGIPDSIHFVSDDGTTVDAKRIVGTDIYTVHTVKEEKEVDCKKKCADMEIRLRRFDLKPGQKVIIRGINIAPVEGIVKGYPRMLDVYGRWTITIVSEGTKVNDIFLDHVDPM